MATLNFSHLALTNESFEDWSFFEIINIGILDLSKYSSNRTDFHKRFNLSHLKEFTVKEIVCFDHSPNCTGFIASLLKIHSLEIISIKTNSKNLISYFDITDDCWYEDDELDLYNCYCKNLRIFDVECVIINRIFFCKFFPTMNLEYLTVNCIIDTNFDVAFQKLKILKIIDPVHYIFPAESFSNKRSFPVLEKIEIGKGLNKSLIPKDFGILVVEI